MSVKFRLQAFSGIRPRADAKVLGDTEATIAINSRLTDGKLTPYRNQKSVATSTIPTTAGATLYRMYDDTTDYWLGWDDDVNVIRHPNLGDESFRIAFTGAKQEPRQTNLALAAVGAAYPDSWYVLGVTPPVTAPTVVPTGGTGDDEDRIYVYTFVTPWGEESAPSPANVAVTGKPDATQWAISGMDVAPLNSSTITAGSWTSGIATVTIASTFGLRVGEYISVTAVNPTSYNANNVKITALTATTVSYALASDPGVYVAGGNVVRDAPHNTTGMVKRIYRSVTTASNAGFFFVGEIPVATTTFNDTAAIVVGEEQSTSTWEMPPVGLEGAVLTPGGSLVGFEGNTIYVSEPNAIYAFPTAFRFVTPFPIIGIGTAGTSIVAVTEGLPYIVDGQQPEYMILDKIDHLWAGTSKRSVVSTEAGVLWSSQVGLAMYGLGGAQLLTRQHYTQREWAEELATQDFDAGFYDNKYFGLYQDAENVYHLWIFDIYENIVSQMDLAIDTLYLDPQTNGLYGAQAGTLSQIDANESSNLIQTWQSKTFDMNNPINLAVAQVEAKYARTPAEQTAYEAAVAAQEALNAAAISNLELMQSSVNDATVNEVGFNASVIKDASEVLDGAIRRVTFNLYANGALLFSTNVQSDELFRLPGGLLYDEIAVRVFAAIAIDSVVMATSVRELRD